MSSVNFSVGFPSERNSSRVLKPPGGGHTDIFGVKDLQQGPIKEVVFDDQEKAETGSNEMKPPKVDEVAKAKEEAKPDVPRRGRVPPGGFSSGLW